MFYEVIIWSRDTVPLSFLFFSQSSFKGPSLLKTLLILTATTHEKEFQRMIKNVSALFPFFHFCCLCITTTWMDSSLKPVLAKCKGITHFDESDKNRTILNSTINVEETFTLGEVNWLSSSIIIVSISDYVHVFTLNT